MRPAILAIMCIAACAPGGQGAPGTGGGTGANDGAGAAAGCGAAARADLVGQPLDRVAEAALPARIRVLPPGAMRTMDHRPDRLNIDTDARGVITRLWCG